MRSVLFFVWASVVRPGKKYMHTTRTSQCPNVHTHALNLQDCHKTSAFSRRCARVGIRVMIAVPKASPLRDGTCSRDCTCLTLSSTGHPHHILCSEARMDWENSCCIIGVADVSANATKSASSDSKSSFLFVTAVGLMRQARIELSGPGCKASPIRLAIIGL